MEGIIGLEILYGVWSMEGMYTLRGPWGLFRKDAKTISCVTGTSG